MIQGLVHRSDSREAMHVACAVGAATACETFVESEPPRRYPCSCLPVNSMGLFDGRHSTSVVVSIDPARARVQTDKPPGHDPGAPLRMHAGVGRLLTEIGVGPVCRVEGGRA